MAFGDNYSFDYDEIDIDFLEKEEECTKTHKCCGQCKGQFTVKNMFGLSLCLLLYVVGFSYYDNVFIVGINNYRIRKQFEFGLVKSLTDKDDIKHEKKWAQSQEMLYSIIGKWNCYSSDLCNFHTLSHYQVISKFFKDIETYKNKNEFEIHQITLVIRDMHDIIAELDHFENDHIDTALRGFWSKNPWDPRVTHIIFKLKHEMRNDLLKCLKLWNNKQYYASGYKLGIFINDYLYYEQTAQDFENEHLSDLFNMNPTDDIQETVVQDVPPQDPMDKWRKKAKFRKF